MANLNWIRVDVNLHSNHKTLELLSQRGGDHALCVWVFSLGYCGGQGNSGFVPAAALGLMHGRKRDAELLVEVGMWEPIEGGWMIHDWAAFQPSDEESQARTEKAKKAAAARWAKQRGKAA